MQIPLRHGLLTEEQNPVKHKANMPPMGVHRCTDRVELALTQGGPNLHMASSRHEGVGFRDRDARAEMNRMKQRINILLMYDIE